MDVHGFFLLVFRYYFTFVFSIGGVYFSILLFRRLINV